MLFRAVSANNHKMVENASLPRDGKGVSRLAARNVMFAQKPPGCGGFVVLVFAIALGGGAFVGVGCAAFRLGAVAVDEIQNQRADVVAPAFARENPVVTRARF